MSEHAQGPTPFEGALVSTAQGTKSHVFGIVAWLQREVRDLHILNFFKRVYNI
jgi:hypothetical protein